MTLKRGLCSLMRLYSSSSASVSGVGQGYINSRHLTDERLYFRLYVAGVKVTADPRLEIAGLANATGSRRSPRTSGTRPGAMAAFERRPWDRMQWRQSSQSFM